MSVYNKGNDFLMGTTEKSIILVTKGSDGKYTLVLKDFSVGGANVGNATVSNIEGNEKNGTVTLEATNVDAVITNGLNEDPISPIEKVSMTMTASISGDYLIADISEVSVPGFGSFYAKFNSKIYPSISLFDDFESDWVKCTPWDSKNNTQAVGTTPNGWCVSNVYAKVLGVTVKKTVGTRINKEVDEDLPADYTVKLTNTSKEGQNIPAYMTLGTSWATSIGFGNNADGGSFGGKEFTLRPDAISFDYMRDDSKGPENATIVAYLWKGKYTQHKVPGNVAGTELGLKYCDMIDRDRNILGMPTDRGGDVETANNATCIASFTHSITEATDYDTWENLTIPFEYKTSDTPEKINIIFAATDYFDRSKIVPGNSLTIDNVKFVYYHALSDIKINGETINGFNENRTEYTVKGNMADYKNALDCTVKGQGASKEVNWNDAENFVTITVKGSNYAEDKESMTVYTIKFEGTGTGIHNVTSTSTSTANGAIYDLSGRQLKTMQKGINIVRGKDGKMIKVMK